MRRDRFILYGIVTLLIIFLVGIVILAVQNQNISALLKHERTPEIGEKAFLFQATDLTGQKVDIHGVNVLLIFFNTTCKRSLESVRGWQEFYENYSSQRIKVVGISSEPAERMKQFITEQQLTFPIVADPEHKILWKYRVRYVPLLVLVDRKGTILYYQRYGERMTDVLSEVEKRILDRKSQRELNDE